MSNTFYQRMAENEYNRVSGALSSGWNDLWSGITSPQGQAAISQTAQISAAAGAGMVAPAFGVAPTAASTLVASTPEVARRQYGLMVNQAYWNKLKTPILIAGLVALGGGALKRSTPLMTIGAVALGGYAYGRSRYGA